MCICEIEVATLFLMLASDTMMAMEGDEAKFRASLVGNPIETTESVQ